MSLEFMYITNNIDIAIIAENAGVHRIWIDLEKIGKEKRQPGNTVKSDHCLNDIKKIKSVLKKSKLQVRINPINLNSYFEVNKAIEFGADIIMLPYFKSVKEVSEFLKYVDGRITTNLLIETKEACDCIDEIMELDGIDECHIGLNDLSLSYQKRFMFELVADGTVEKLCNKIRKKNIPFGFGGIARVSGGKLAGRYIIAEHYRLNSTRVILSRSFANSKEFLTDKYKFESEFRNGIDEIKKYETYLEKQEITFFKKNLQDINTIVNGIVSSM